MTIVAGDGYIKFNQESVTSLEEMAVLSTWSDKTITIVDGAVKIALGAFGISAGIWAYFE